MRLLLPFILFISFYSWGAELQVPALKSPVMDEAGFLTPSERQDLSQLAYELHANNGPQITVLTVSDMQGYPIEEFSIRVAEKWKLGLKEKGNGLLITIAKKERQMRIEVGEGIEGEITDYEANYYIRKILTPAFKQGQFHQGLRTVMIDVARTFNINLAPESSRVARRVPPPRHLPGPLVKAFPFIILFLILGQIFLRKKPVARGVFTGSGIAGAGFFLLPGVGLGFVAVLFIIGLCIGIIGLHNLLFALAASRGGRYGGGGFGGGGGGWSGGGGGFSGGGSSGSW